MSPSVRRPASGDGDLVGGAAVPPLQAVSMKTEARAARAGKRVNMGQPMLPNEPWSVFGTEMRVLLVLIVVFTAACGSVGLGASPSPTPSDNPMHFDVTATEKDHAVSMHVGQKLELVLNGGTGISYGQVRSSNQSILEPTVDPAATAVRGVTLAAFRAKASGQATVTAVGAPVCASNQACPMFAILYTLTVTIT